jgi:hypothetical protein
MSNIEKLIASTIINHGGVPATETKTQRMAGVIEVLKGAIKVVIKELPFGLILDAEIISDDKAEILIALESVENIFEQALQQAEAIAGGE